MGRVVCVHTDVGHEFRAKHPAIARLPIERVASAIAVGKQSQLARNVQVDRLLRVELPQEARQSLGARLEELPWPETFASESFIRGAFQSVVSSLPSYVLDVLSNAKDSPQPPGAILIRGCPVDPVLPATPRNGLSQSPRDARIAKAFLVGVARILGSPYAYEIEKQGELIHNVVPVPGNETSLTNMGSKSELGFHTEMAYFSHPPRRLMLSCLRPDHERVAQTPVADVRDAIEILDPEHVAELRRPHFRVRCPFIFDAFLPIERRFSRPRAVLTGPARSPEVRVALYGDLTQPLTPEGRRALDALDSAVRQVARPIKLDAGDMVILDNFTVLHARTPFQPRFDGVDRWLIRCHVAESLWPHRRMQRSGVRILTR